MYPITYPLSSLICHLQQNKLDLDLYNHSISPLGRICFCFSSPPDDATYLVSGTITFLNEQSKWIRNLKKPFKSQTNTLDLDVPSLISIKISAPFTQHGWQSHNF